MPGKNILLLEKEMASSVMPFQNLCKVTGSTLAVIDDPRISSHGKGWAECIIDRIDLTVAVVIVPHVHWCDGSYVDILRIREAIDTLPIERRPFASGNRWNSVDWGASYRCSVHSARFHGVFYSQMVKWSLWS